MKLVFRKPFAEFFNDNIRQGDGRGLIGRMQALEVRKPWSLGLDVTPVKLVFSYV